MLLSNHYVASLGLLFFCHVCMATTVTAIICPKGIVIASDSGATKETHGNASAGREASVVKFIAVQKHLIVATIGISDISGMFRGRQYDYHFVDWMSKLQDGLPPGATPNSLAERIATEAALTLDGFADVIGSGETKQEDIREKFGLFIEYVILGYSMAEPQIYDVRFYIDWDNKKLFSPKTILVHPNENSTAGNYSFYSFGVKEALDDIRNPASYAYQQLFSRCPSFGRLIARRDINLPEIVEIAQAEVRIEEDINPTHVFGAIVSTTISPTGIVGAIERVSPHDKVLTPTAKRKSDNH
jgi:hypothetical protein